MLIEATGGSYIDEATGVSTPLSTPLHSVLLNAVGGNASIAVTALTELAYLNANAAVGGLTTTNVQTAVAGVQNNFGVPDILNTMPVDALAVPAGATAAQKGYALALATISQYQLSLGAGTNLAAAMTPLQNCLATPATACATVTPALNTALTTFTTAHAAAFTGVTLPAVATFGTTPVNPPVAQGGGNPALLPVTVVGTQMGGARQGVALNLTGSVTTQTPPLTINTFPAYINSATGTSSVLTVVSKVATDGTSLYTVDSTSALIKIDIATGGISILAGQPGVSGNVDGIGTAARFKNLQGVTTDGVNVYVTDDTCIRKVSIATGQVTTIAGSQVNAITAKLYIDGVGIAATFNTPTDLTTDGTNLFVADKGNGNVRKIVIATGQVTTLAGPAAADCGPSAALPLRSTCPSGSTLDSVGTLARFTNLMNAISTDGVNLYVSDNTTIRKIVISTGQVTTIAGSPINGFGYADGIGVLAQFSAPTGITTDGTSLYITDSSNIRKIDLATALVTTLAGPNNAICLVSPGGACPGGVAVDAVGTAARFAGLGGIATDGKKLYVSDRYTMRIIQ